MEIQQKDGIVQENLLSALKSNKSFGTFVNVIDVSGLTPVLNRTDQYTLFAPNR